MLKQLTIDYDMTLLQRTYEHIDTVHIQAEAVARYETFSTFKDVFIYRFAPYIKKNSLYEGPVYIAVLLAPYKSHLWQHGPRRRDI